jgi:hypothetical protein
VAITTPAQGQPRRATLRGHATLADGADVPGLAVTLRTEDEAALVTVETDAAGRFEIRDVAPGSYLVSATNGPFAARRGVTVDTAPVVEVPLRLSLPSDPPLEVVASVDPFGRAQTTSSADALRALPARLQTRALPQALAATPGWAEEDNGLLHVRGVDDGVLYVEDGIPVYDRLDVAFGIPPALADIGTVRVTTGHTPAAFGLKAGAVVEVFTPPAPERWTGRLQAGTGSSALGGAVVSGGGPARGALDTFAAVSAERSARFLDPVHPDNLHNTGGVAGASIRATIAVSPTTIVSGNARLGRSRFDVPHAEAQEAAGQDQRQRTTQTSQSLAWQQTFGVSALHVAGYHRWVDARLLGSSSDTPVAAASTRRHDRLGLLGSVARFAGGHSITVGAEVSRAALTENFRFAVTDPDADDLSAAAAAFTPSQPFVFSGHVARPQWSAYVNDHVNVGPLTLDAGVRFDRTRLLESASHWGPRLGVAIELIRFDASVRASFNGLFQPPQAEHLLLSSSPEARALSPFVDEPDGGGAALAPERQSAWEIGVEQRLGRHLRVDVSAWHRRVRNYTDPNVFFGTTIVFPNSVARGTARGLDVRLQMPAVRGWTASAAYTLSKVVQEGPINGGLFLEDDIDTVGPGVTFTPDHDQRHVAAATLAWVQPVGRWTASAQARYASGTPVELGDFDDDDLADLVQRPGVELVDLARGRVRPRLVVDVAASVRVRRAAWGDIGLGMSVLNAADRAYAFNFGNPFSGTHFGAPRTFRVDLQIGLR